MGTSLRDYFQNYDSNAVELYCREMFSASEIDCYSIVQEARVKTIEYARGKKSHYIRRNTMAEEMYSNMVGLFSDYYPDLVFEDKGKCPYLKLADDVWIFPKKLNKKYLPGNIITNRVKRLRGQELFSEDYSKIHVLYVGPVLTNKNWFEDFKGVYASYVNEYYPANTEWVIDLKDYSRKSLIIPMESAQEAQEEFLVKVPQKDKDDGAERKSQ